MNSDDPRYDPKLRPGERMPSPEWWARKPLIGGFDPGKKGAFVTIDAKTGKIDGIMRVPLITTRHNHRAPKKPTFTTEIDWEELNSVWGEQMQYCRRIYIEHIWGASPAGKGRRDGGASQFKMGYAAGVPFGLILSWGVPYHFVTPQVWKGKLNYPDKPLVEKTAKDGTKTMEKIESWKAPSFDMARKFFPDSVDEFARVTMDEGVAEAALIAYVGRQFLEVGHAGS